MKLLDELEEFSISGTATNGEECIIRLSDNNADIALVDFSLPKISGVKVVEFVSKNNPQIISVLLSEKSNQDFYRSGMLAGAREFIVTPVSSEELGFALDRVTQIAGGSKTERRMHGYKGENIAKDGRILLAASGKGGTGASFISANLARIISERDKGSRVAIVDFNLRTGNLATIFNIHPSKTLKDLMPVISELEPDLLMSVGQKLTANLDLFAAPQEIELHNLFTSEQTNLLIECWRRSYDLTIIDVGINLDEASSNFFEASDLTLVTLVADVLSVKSAKRLVDYLGDQGLSKNNILAVMNRWEELFLPPERVARHIGVNDFASLPESTSVRILLEEGRLLEDADETDLRFAVDGLIESVCRKLSMVENVHVN